ncbi:MAG: hypothetical protein RIQ60_2044 [Pseudomonadota bacterium]|jgi:hypothetical protein
MKKPLSKKPPYSLEKEGNFGVFQSGESLPVHYLLTTLGVPELEKLTLARHIRQEKIDFELLMQRDIDVDRVNREIIKYLAPDPGKSPAEILSRPLFFPPLLVAVIPVIDRAIQAFLPDESVEPIDLGGAAGIRRSWGDIVNLNYYQAEDGDGFEVTGPEGKVYRCEKYPVQLQVRRPESNSGVVGAELVVFDGQHRYEALKRLAGTGLLKGLSVPVCIVLSPNSTAEHFARSPQSTRPVPEVFRTLFVDVNKNAVTVGGHFNTLLSDSSVGSIACRIFCETVLDTHGEEGLAVVEWNIRNKKDATQIKRSYSITSIGVIEQALAKSLSNKRDHWSLLKYVLALDDVESDLYPADSENEPTKVEWDRFSPNQRRILEGQIRKRLVKQGLERIFFEAAEYRRACDTFREQVAEYKQTIATRAAGFDVCEAVLQEVLEYVPIPEDSKALKASVGLFERSVEGRLEARINPIIRYGIFQRGMIAAWMSLVSRLRSCGELDFNSITTGYISLLDWILDRERAIFSERKQRYMVYSVFRASSQIKPTESTRDAITSLILAALGNKAIANRFVVAATGAASASLESILVELGLNGATRFAGIYRKERMAEFARSYRSDFSIPRDERDELGQLEDAVNDLKRRVREKSADVGEYSAALEKFNGELGNRVSKEVELALGDLRSALSYDSVVVEAGEVEDVEIEES